MLEWGATSDVLIGWLTSSLHFLLYFVLCKTGYGASLTFRIENNPYLFDATMVDHDKNSGSFHKP